MKNTGLTKIRCKTEYLKKELEILRKEVTTKPDRVRQSNKCYILRETDIWDGYETCIAVFQSYPTAKELKNCTEKHGLFRDCDALPITFYEKLAEERFVLNKQFGKELDLPEVPFYATEK